MKTMTTNFPIAASGEASSSVSSYGSRQKSRSLEFKLIHALAFVTFVIIGTVWYVASLGFLRRGEQGAESPIAAARNAADSSVPFVFQRH